MGEHEFRLDDLRRVTPIDLLFAIPNFPFERVGPGGLKPSGEANQLCEEQGNAARLGLSHAQAMAVAQLRGCRLPTSAEWDAARQNLTQAVWSAAKKSIEDHEAFGDGSPEALKRDGDLSSDGIVGLGFGVREWVSDAKLPKGDSNRGLEKDAPAGEMMDVGFRLALDAVPAGIRRLAELAALPAPAQDMARRAAKKISEETDLAKLKAGLAQLEAQAGQVRPQMEPVSDFLRKTMNERIAELEKGAR
jgi:hypothetical protein